MFARANTVVIGGRQEYVGIIKINGITHRQSQQSKRPADILSDMVEQGILEKLPGGGREHATGKLPREESLERTVVRPNMH